jgi:hypothetical protein
MKSIRPISSIILTLLVLMASSSFYVDMHFCGGDVKEMAFLEQADGCGHQQLPPCHRALMKGCCENETISHEGQGFKNSFVKISIDPSLSIDIEQSQVLLSEVIPTVPVAKTQYHNYDPPLRSTDRTIDLQVFLI